MLEFKNLSKSFHENKVLDHINLKIEKGDVVGIIGPSGTGKSTLLRCINQLEIPEEGEAVFGGKTVDLSKKHKDSLEFRKITGMVFQRFYLFEKKTALENEAVQNAIKAAAEALGSDGRILVRESGTEPVIRVMVEAATDEICTEYVNQVVNVMKEQGLVQE